MGGIDMMSPEYAMRVSVVVAEGGGPSENSHMRVTRQRGREPLQRVVEGGTCRGTVSCHSRRRARGLAMCDPLQETNFLLTGKQLVVDLGRVASVAPFSRVGRRKSLLDPRHRRAQ